MSAWLVYLIRAGDDSLYTGITTDVARRLAEHEAGGVKGARYLRGRGPLTLAYTHAVDSRSVASQLEYRIKRLSKEQKEALVAGTADATAWYVDLHKP